LDVEKLERATGLARQLSSANNSHVPFSVKQCVIKTTRKKIGGEKQQQQC
jgi:hypothetical protein